MSFKSISSALIALLIADHAIADVRLTSDAPSGAMADVFSSGDLLSIDFYLFQDADAPLFGAEFSVTAATGDLRIRSVTFNPAFSAVLGEESAATPNASSNGAVEAARVQPLGGINQNLGADGSPVHFATVELEVLTDAPFESALIVRARGALVGEIPDSTIVLGNPSGEDGWGVGRIEIVNSSDGAGDQATGEQVNWTGEQASAEIEIRPASGGAAVTALAPNTEYEIHYHAGDQGAGGSGGQGVNGFDLFVTADSAPIFDLCWPGAEITDLPALPDPQDPGSPKPPATRWVISADALGEFQSRDHEAVCSFTTGPAGWIDLDLRLYSTDPQAREVVEMPASMELTIE
jgi:hypothetical protein